MLTEDLQEVSTPINLGSLDAVISVGSEPLDRVPCSRQRARDLALVLAFALWYPGIGCIVFLMHGSRITAKYGSFGMLPAVIVEFSSLWLLAHVLKRQGRSFRSIGLSFAAKDVLRGVGLWLLSAVAVIVVWFAVNWLLLATGHGFLKPKNVDQMLAIQKSWAWLLFMLVNPWYEELIVRAYLMTELQALTGRWWIAAVVSVAIQTVYHAYQGLINMAMVGISFSVLAIYFARKRRALPVVTAHEIQDLLAFLNLVAH